MSIILVILFIGALSFSIGNLMYEQLNDDNPIQRLFAPYNSNMPQPQKFINGTRNSLAFLLVFTIASFLIAFILDRL